MVALFATGFDPIRSFKKFIHAGPMGGSFFFYKLAFNLNPPTPALLIVSLMWLQEPPKMIAVEYAGHFLALAASNLLMPGAPAF
ncbi:hypothetical protein BS47DRAFT_1397377 [Hydnum rufescens UP504]|uniref:Uncharacterized protein n=1 Tax=Hydnum rufescens UP504 TaxID=1448309 RepID=A0A9P6AN95_9AGAM|nr:hypothetical protein BS47DRAFT_1397377 [Hydnum rufescens UP504]